MPGTEQLPRARSSLTQIAARAETALDKTNRRVLWGIAIAVAVALVLSSVAFYRSVTSARTTAALVAGDTASSEVGAARASSLLVVRRDLTAVNQAMVAAGLTPCADPGPQASAYQVAWVTAECAGTLRTIGELQKRGVVQLPGVSAPDPASGRFPRPQR